MFHLKSFRPARLAASGGITLALLAGAVVLPATTLAGSTHPTVVTTRTCTAGSTTKLTAQRHGSRIEMEFEVDHRLSSQAWTIVVKDNGHRVFSGSRGAGRATDSFSVDRYIRNRAGVDRIAARATNRVTGEVCTATLRI